MASQTVPERMPGKLKVALVAVWLQGVLNAAGGVLLLAVVNDEAQHGRDDGLGLLRFLAVLSFLAAAALITCAVLTPRRTGWVRGTVIGLEIVTVVSVLITFFSGGAPSAIVGLALAAAVLTAFMSPEGKAWFAR
ncbi:hypothetical protein QWM81_03160 [Streptomyces ficellus]|uniref:Integral membrane protein n=1 Tax=Streptomyces ficellus TaxID=1977088 RepID=A0ABT7Z0P9_9ACTN|nr:hypothetical protein [Streptomyces ficellus]MDN3293060.1 hypothetical protein [Streptomyces ficellus]